jgi:hypothetical protein
MQPRGHIRPQQAAATFKRVIQICPESPRAQAARERLQRIQGAEEDPYS